MTDCKRESQPRSPSNIRVHFPLTVFCDHGSRWAHGLLQHDHGQQCTYHGRGSGHAGLDHAQLELVLQTI